MKITVIGPKKLDPVGFNQIFPFIHNKSKLKKKLGVRCNFSEANSLREIKTNCESNFDSDVLFVRVGWRESPEDVLSFFKGLRNNYEGAVVFIDPFDQTSSRFFSVLPYIDLMVKYQSLKDKSLYLDDYIGGNFATDRLAKEGGLDIGGWHVGSKVEPGQEGKIYSGWYAVNPQIYQSQGLFRKLFNSKKQKDIDIFCHVSCGARDDMEWYGIHRAGIVEKIKKLAGKYEISVSADYAGEPRVDRKTYLDHLKRSKIIVSPLGWGEITMRAYESIIYGGLLMQPCVDHIQTQPNLFDPMKTYVPVAWDFSDFEEKVEYYIKHPDKAELVVENAKTAFNRYLINDEFINTVADILGRLGVSGGNEEYQPFGELHTS